MNANLTNATHKPTGHRCYVMRYEGDRAYCNFVEATNPFCYVPISELKIDLKTLSDKEIDDLALQALDAAALLIQERLGVKTGDLAGMFFSDGLVEHELRKYIQSELNYGE